MEGGCCPAARNRPACTASYHWVGVAHLLLIMLGPLHHIRAVVRVCVSMHPMDASQTHNSG